MYLCIISTHLHSLGLPKTSTYREYEYSATHIHKHRRASFIFNFDILVLQCQGESILFNFTLMLLLLLLVLMTRLIFEWIFRLFIFDCCVFEAFGNLYVHIGDGRDREAYLCVGPMTIPDWQNTYTIAIVRPNKSLNEPEWSTKWSIYCLWI